MAKLYVVATPIGNLEDIGLRALRILKEVDFILCEDTRVTKKLLKHYEIKTRTVSYHQHSNSAKTDFILRLLKKDKKLALVSDSGTPCISDPGGKLVQAVVEGLGDKVEIESVPGPSALTAAVSISGFPVDKFLFLGFPPHKKGRQKFLSQILESKTPVVIFESRYRILKFLQELRKKFLEKGEGEGLKEKDTTSLVICRELSKMHETIYRGGVDDLIAQLDPKKEGSPKDQKGEFVVVIY